jgi:hypothetical protein
MSPAEVMVTPMLVSDEVAKVCDEPVWDDEYCAPIAVIPPPAPASAPQLNCPVVAFQMSLSPDPEHEVNPAPKKYPLFKLIPWVTDSPPATVEVAFVEVALKLPKVGVEVAVMTPDALVERSELTAVALRVMALENVFASDNNVVDDTETEPPSETEVPLMVIDEFVRPALFKVPVSVGVSVSAPPVGTMV